jgi:outer membrane protein assembly factor BamB
MIWMPTVLVQAGDWPQWRGPDRNGVWIETDLLNSFPPGGLKLSWRAPVGRGWSSPIVSHGRVYVTDAVVTRPVAYERVLCFEETTGKLSWVHKYSVDYPDWAFAANVGGPRATPIINDGRLFTLGALGHLFCLDAVKGGVIWQKSLAKYYGVKEFTGITASPLIEDNLLILYICGKPAACVVALNKNSGREAWRAMDDSFTYSSPVVITAGGKRQLIVWTQEAVTSLDPATGRTWWREALSTPGDMAVATPVFTAQRLFVAGLMFRFEAGNLTPSVLWPADKAATKRILSNTSTALLQSDYLFSARTSGELVCLEAATGRQVWQANTVTELKTGASIHLTPCADAVFLFTDRGDLIHADLSPQGYREISRSRLLEPTSPFGDRKCAWTPPAFANRHVFARNDAELVCASLAAPRQ